MVRSTEATVSDESTGTSSSSALRPCIAASLPQITESPQMTLEAVSATLVSPQITELPQMTELASITSPPQITELLQMTEFAAQASEPQITESPQMTHWPLEMPLPLKVI